MEQPKLLGLVRNLIRTKHYSIRTEEAYVGWIKRFILFYGKSHPRKLGKKEISAFLTHLAVNRNVSASTQNQAFNALLFLYRHVLEMEFEVLDTVERAKKPKRLPVVFTKDEIFVLKKRGIGVQSPGDMIWN
jgi:site-specific recombinase XerD